MSVQSCKESILFSPDQVLVLVVHAHTINDILVRYWKDYNVIITLNEGVAAAKLAFVNLITISANSVIQLVLFYRAS